MRARRRAAAMPAAVPVAWIIIAGLYLLVWSSAAQHSFPPSSGRESLLGFRAHPLLRSPQCGQGMLTVINLYSLCAGAVGRHVPARKGHVSASWCQVCMHWARHDQAWDSTLADEWCQVMRAMVSSVLQAACFSTAQVLPWL